MQAALVEGMKSKKLILGAALVAALLPFITTAHADSSSPVDLTPQLQSMGLAVDGLQAIEIGGIVILRGTTPDAATASHAGLLVKDLGYSRVANLIRVVEPPDDAAIQRAVERRLAMHRALDGCKLRVESNGGLVTVAGTVSSEIQKDVAVRLVRRIDGVRAVKADFE
jgi:osmotically-inducible protein OsmY